MCVFEAPGYLFDSREQLNLARCLFTLVQIYLYSNIDCDHNLELKINIDLHVFENLQIKKSWSPQSAPVQMKSTGLLWMFESSNWKFSNMLKF